jgi:hypothetical protein
MPFPQKKPVIRRPQSLLAVGQALDWSIHSIGAQAPGTGKAASRGFRAAFTLLLAAAVLLAGCSRPAPEAALRASVERMQAAAEARDSSALVADFSAQFVGPEGMDRDQFRRTLAVLWLRNREVGVALGPLDVAVAGEGARVEFTAATRGGDGWLPDRAQVYRVKTGWRLEGGEWKLVSASWEPSL